MTLTGAFFDHIQLKGSNTRPTVPKGSEGSTAQLQEVDKDLDAFCFVTDAVVQSHT